MCMSNGDLGAKNAKRNHIGEDCSTLHKRKYSTNRDNEPARESQIQISTARHLLHSSESCNYFLHDFNKKRLQASEQLVLPTDL